MLTVWGHFFEQALLLPPSPLCALRDRRVRWCAVIGGEQFISWPHSWFRWSASRCLACVVQILGKPSLLANQPTKFSIHFYGRPPPVCLHTDTQSVGHLGSQTGSNSGLSVSRPSVFFKLFESTFSQHLSAFLSWYEGFPHFIVKFCFESDWRRVLGTMPTLLFSAFVPFFVTLLIFLIFVFIPCSGGKSGNKKTDGVKVTIFFDHYQPQ